MTGAARTDSFVTDHLPPPEQWPARPLALPELQYPPQLNCVPALLDRWDADRPCLIAPDESWSYGQLRERVDRIAGVLAGELGLVPGGRVLLRAANTPMLVACYLAVMKAGGVAVATMPLLRARELAWPITKARIALALCDARLVDELRAAQALAPALRRIICFNTDAPDGLEALMAAQAPGFAAAPVAAEHPALIGFTSGTTGEPKGTVHSHRDVLAICDTYARHILRAEGDDRFIGSPPLAFTFGLGGLVLFPLHVGAAAILLERAGPEQLLEAIPRHRATICFTAPTAYRAMLARLAGDELSSLRKCVSAGETLPAATYQAFLARTGIRLMDGIGATEMLHIFIAAREDEIRPGATGRPVPGYEARIVDADMHDLPDGTPGLLAVRGPTGCRYLDDPRQTRYVRDGWNLTGDVFLRDADGYFWFQARSDDMIVSAGYNIAGPEVEAVLLAHPAVAECAVIGAPDEERGQIVRAFVVLRPGHTGNDAMTRALQDFVKATIAPYKYPRAIAYREALPRTQTGKLQRYRLRGE